MGDRGGWRLCPPELREDDEALVAAVVALHRDLYERYFSREPLAHHKLPIQVRAFRRTGDWRIFLLLCPWMLSRCFWPDADPGIPLPAGMRTTRCWAPSLRFHFWRPRKRPT